MRLPVLAFVLTLLVAPSAQAVTFTPAPGSPVPVGHVPEGIAVGDLNNDNKADFVTNNHENLDSNGENSISVRLGNGDGTFTIRPSVAIPNQSASGGNDSDVALGDFDDDGNLDVVAPTDYGTAVALGQGDGTFAPATLIPSTSFRQFVKTGDFDENGTDDLVLTSSQGSVGVLLSNGDGTFQTEQSFEFPDPDRQAAFHDTLTVADFNGDGHLDFSSFAVSDALGVWLGNGDGTFGEPVFTPVGTPSGPHHEFFDSAASADFDGDGHQDIAFSADGDTLNPSGFVVGILLGHGDGTFTLAGTAGIPAQTTVAVADFDQDGLPDLVTAQFDGQALGLFLGNGDGTLTRGVTEPATGNHPTSLATADADRDGYPDVLAASSSDDDVSVLLNDGPLVTGSGQTAKAPVNNFSISAFDQGGTLIYTAPGKSFAGNVTCTKVVGNAATIVAVSAPYERANRTMVQDNGATGDKLINTAINLKTLSKKSRAKFLACVDPDVAKLNAAPPLAGDAIHVRQASAN